MQFLIPSVAREVWEMMAVPISQLIESNKAGVNRWNLQPGRLPEEMGEGLAVSDTLVVPCST